MKHDDQQSVCFQKKFIDLYAYRWRMKTSWSKELMESRFVLKLVGLVSGGVVRGMSPVFCVPL